MKGKDSEKEDLIQAILGCGLGWEQNPSENLQKKWKEFTASQQYKDQAFKICESLAKLWKDVYVHQLELKDTAIQENEKDETIKLLWNDFVKWLHEESENINQTGIDKDSLKNVLKNSFEKAIREVLEKPSVNLPNLENSPENSSETANQISPTEQSSINQTPSSSTEQLSLQSVKDEGSPSTKKPQSPVMPQWKYVPIPEDEPDRHEEFDCQSDISPNGLKIIGARVRGKKHKHEGTNCDDWFKFAVSGNWTIIAVADGAGSKKFSRVGAKTSCEAEVAYLVKKLANHTISERETEEDLANDLKRNSDWAFPKPDIDFVQNALHEAIESAYDGLQKEADQRYKNTDYYKALGHKHIDIKDLSATLLLAVHTQISIAGELYDFVLTCQIGDGMLAAISQEGRLSLIGQPDSGEYAGQTEFLTSKNQLERNNLVQKTSFFPGKLKALMVMTDGVADNYIPPNPGMLELYGDLVLNGVINIAKPNPEDINYCLRTTQLPSLSEVQEKQSLFQDKVERILPENTNEPKSISLYSVAKYAGELGSSVKEVVESPALLAAVNLAESQNYPPEKKLEIWLDSYYQKGSFDDRTLVILYREDQ